MHRSTQFHTWSVFTRSLEVRFDPHSAFDRALELWLSTTNPTSNSLPPLVSPSLPSLFDVETKISVAFLEMQPPQLSSQTETSIEKPSQPETFIPTSIVVSSVAPVSTPVFNPTDTMSTPNSPYLSHNLYSRKMVTEFENARVLVTDHKILVKDCMDNMGNGVAEPFGTTEIALPHKDISWIAHLIPPWPPPPTRLLNFLYENEFCKNIKPPLRLLDQIPPWPPCKHPIFAIPS
ncbi:hypothetical protein NE237_020456 [Protea cynaroides]|uniref:Uncharacterized protein n=1 Tax=Protea cynaroides TaxID=273540 RepID=A0A9Q0H5Z7_9MAGN|nr:hypothetical protein NE237_020456 [Protea cynaroides]